MAATATASPPAALAGTAGRIVCAGERQFVPDLGSCDVPRYFTSIGGDGGNQVSSVNDSSTWNSKFPVMVTVFPTILP